MIQKEVMKEFMLGYSIHQLMKRWAATRTEIENAIRLESKSWDTKKGGMVLTQKGDSFPAPLVAQESWVTPEMNQKLKEFLDKGADVV